MKSKDIRFPTSQEYSVKDIKNVQKELLKMTKIIVRILEDNDIPYFMAFGTLIGAVKFKGFLPWDDDIDLFLFDDSYSNAIELLETHLPKYLIVHSERNDPNYFLSWNSVKNINTSVEISNIYHPHNKLLGYKCLGVDLYRLKKLPCNLIDKYKQEEALKFFERKYNKGLIDKYKFEEEVKKLKSDFDISTVIDFRNNDEVFYFVVKLKSPIALNSVFPLKKMAFEDTQFYAPRDPIKVLSATFTNLNELPSYEDRKPHLKRVKLLN